MKRLTVILTLCVGIFLGADAQSFTQRIQQNGGGSGKVTIHQDSNIDRLVNQTNLTNTPAAPETNTTKPAQPQLRAQSTGGGEQEVGQQPDLSKKVMRGSKASGYRVQAFAGGNTRKDRQRAESIAASIKGNYPEVPVYVHFYSPRWICRVGNYRTYEEAHQMLVSLRNLGYSQAVIVKSKVTVQY